METWYKVGSMWWHVPITKVDVEKVTVISVWIEGTPHRRITFYECYFPTWKEAHDHLVKRAQDALTHAAEVKNKADERLARVLALTEVLSD